MQTVQRSNSKTTRLEVPSAKLNEKILNVTVKGTSSLLLSCYTEAAAKRQLLSQLGQAQAAKDKDLTVEAAAHAAAYWYDIKNYKLGVKGDCFKRALENAAKQLKDRKVPSTMVRGNLFIVGTKTTDQGDLLPLTYGSYRPRADSAFNEKVGRVQAVRMEVADWGCIVPIEYDETSITASQILHLLNIAGRKVGIGAWRPSCGGMFGRFEAVSAS